MSTLILQTAGSVIGNAVGGPVGGAIGRALGGWAGSALDAQLFRSHSTVQRSVEGPRMSALPALGSTEGAPIPRVFGRARLGGEIIWATRFEEQVTVTRTSATTSAGGSKGGKSSGRGSQVTQVTTTTTYAYFANLAIGLCEGPIAFVRRVWADGKPLDTGAVTMRVHRGDEDQAPDPLIVAKEGEAAAPAYRGTAYVVFERLPLATFGNRVPQLSFEVVKPVQGLGAMIRAVNLIPGAGEFSVDPLPVSRIEALGASVPENTHQLGHASDWAASLDALQALCPALERVSLLVSWFGDDLRAGPCTIAPRVETAARDNAGATWSVAGLARGEAQVVSRVDGRPASGGTPSDDSVIRAIHNLRARGLAITLNPFLMMDIPAGSGRADPWTGAADQPAYPWRGRMTCDPAPGRPGTADGTASAEAQVAALFGAAQASHYAVAGDTVVYSGPPQWTLSRQVLHTAALAVAAGGVDAILLGSEMVGLTRIRGQAGNYPAVARLAALAAQVRALVGPGTKIAYAADWTEYGAHVPAPGQIRFPLDPLWAHPAIDAVAIDAWWPLADWRDGPLHADAALARGPHDPAYLLAGTAGGEAFDWSYASPADRTAQRRTPITDGLGKPWIHRQKDLLSWWSQPHVERTGGVEHAAPTAWVPRGKPVWLNEIGCPAVDKGANAPSAFPDPKSSEDTRPPFSNGGRDDLMLLRGVEAMLTRFDPSLPGHPAGSNPVSPVYGGRMVDVSRIHVWAWDARPFPAFPDASAIWTDAPAWDTGHWLNGRLEGASLDRLVAAILAAQDAPAASELALDGVCDGFVLDRPLSARAALEPLAAAFGIDAVASSGALRLRTRPPAVALALTEDDLVPDKDGALVHLVRAQESELPHELTVAFVDAQGDYAPAAVQSRRLAGASRASVRLDLPAVLARTEAERIAERALHEAWTARDTASFTVRPGLVALEVGDVVTLPDTGGRRFRIARIRDAGAREIEARAASDSPPLPVSRPATRAATAAAVPAIPGRPFVLVLDWPAARGDPAVLQSLAIAAEPWPGQMAVWRSIDGASFEPAGAIGAPALVGTTTVALPPGPLWRWDRAAALDIALSGDTLADGSDLAALGGASTVAVRGPEGRWEILAFARAELTGPRTFRLTRLLRGLGGSEAAASRGAPAGSPVVVLGGALFDCAAGAEALGRTLRWRIGPAGRDVADAAMLERVATPGGEALKPLAPVRPTARREPAGVRLAWLRRSRSGGDAWEPVEIPLDEASERWEVDILSGGALRRTLSATTPSLLYPADAEIADFGGPRTELQVRIVQLSADVGRGTPLEAVLRIA